MRMWRLCFVPYTGDSGRLNEDVAALFDVIRPVGSLYPTTDANFNPNTAKGWHGKWERIKDCVIYAAGDSDTVGSIVGRNTHTGASGSGTAIDIRSRRLNSIVWRRTA